MRVFVALDLPDGVIDALARLQSKLGAGRHVPPDDLHLTLVFIAEAPLDALEELHMRLDMMTMPLAPLRIAGADVFGSNPPRSLHMTVEGDAPLRDLQKKVANAARLSGLGLPYRRFLPHITLARFSRQLDDTDMGRVGRFLQAHGDWTLPAFVPPALSLYRSTLGADGPRYDLLESYSAGRAPGSASGPSGPADQPR